MTPSDAYRDDVGCATWLIGSAILLGILGLVVLAFKLGPDVLSSNTADPPAATATLTVAADIVATPTEPPQSPAATDTVTLATTEPAPTATVATSPTPVVTATAATLPVPQLVNATLEQAQTAVAAGNWVIATTEEFSDSVAQGHIVSQSPAAQTQLQRGATINVVVSKGSGSVAIPDVRGIAAADARARLEALGFVVQQQPEASAEVAEGLVVRSEPDSSAPTGSTVLLVVSLGDVVTVPDVFQLDVQDATAQLEDAGLDRWQQRAPELRVHSAELGRLRLRHISQSWRRFGFTRLERGRPAGSTIDIAFYDDSL